MLLTPPNPNPGNTPRFRVAGARITGDLDLGCGNTVAFMFTKCRFDNAPNLNDMTSPFVGFPHCYLPGLDANRLVCNGPVWLHSSQTTGLVRFGDAKISGEFDLDGVRFDGAKEKHKVCLCGASIGGDLSLRGAMISGSLGLDCATVSGNLIADGATITGAPNGVSARQASIAGSFQAFKDFKCTGRMYMEGAHIAGQLVLKDAELSADGDWTLDLDHSQVDLGISLDGIRSDRSIYMHHARVGCMVSLRGAKLSSPSRIALRADHLVVDGSLMASKTEIKGEVNLHGADISCILNLQGAKIDANQSVALRGEDIRVGHNILAEGCHIKGIFQVRDAVVGGSVVFSDSQLENPNKYAFIGRRLRVDGRIDMTDNFCAKGTVSLADASIGTTFSFDDGKFSEASDRPCLDASGLQVQGDMLGSRATVNGLLNAAALRCAGDVRMADAVLEGVPAYEASLGSSIDQRKGGTWRGISLRMTGAVIGGDLDLRGATLQRSLVLTKAAVTRSILLTNASLNGSGEGALIADGVTGNTLTLRFRTSPTGAINLTSAHISTLSDGNTSWPVAAPIQIDGFKYERLDSNLDAAERLEWLIKATANYMPQPYEQLASYYVANGNPDEARNIRFESIKRSYQTRAPLARLWGNLQNWTLGFGYRPLRAAVIFIVLWLMGSFWFAVGVGPCIRFGVRWSNLCPDSLTGHPTWNPFIYSFDLLLPIVNLGFKTDWDPTGISRIVSLGLIASGWVLTTTIVAALGRSLRRS